MNINPSAFKKLAHNLNGDQSYRLDEFTANFKKYILPSEKLLVKKFATRRVVDGIMFWAKVLHDETYFIKIGGFSSLDKCIQDTLSLVSKNQGRHLETASTNTIGQVEN